MREVRLQRLALAFMLAAAGCAAPAPGRPAAAPAPSTLELFDKSRQRRIPVALYGAAAGRPRPLAILSHGYGGRSTDYGFIARALAARGYVVASIQQDLPGDPVPASQGDLATLRRPIWQLGADSIRFTIEALHARRIADRRPAVLIGHSNGGDMTMLFAARHPELARAAISLDNRRMAMPRTARPRICSVRSSDFPADPGVLPTPEEQRAHAMLIAGIPGLRHDDMTDSATAAQKQAMLKLIFACLGD